MHLKNRKKLYNERGITFFHETESYVNNLNIYDRSKNGTNLWNDLIFCIKIQSIDNRFWYTFLNICIFFSIMYVTSFGVLFYN